jgi:Cu+-exporting ATPase
VVLAIAALTCGAWLVAGAPASAAVQHAVAVLVIACPCALGLATPAAIAVGTAHGAELGVLFRNATALEAASRIDVACLDKTGTLTTGRPALVGDPDREVLRVAAAAEQASEHPISRAIVDGARARGIAIPIATDVVAEPGGGVAATVEGARVRVGTREYLMLAGIEVPPGVESSATICHVAIDSAHQSWLEVADPPAPEAKAVVARLVALGVEPVMITGDREPVARTVADSVGITSFHADVRPARKAAIVEAQRAAGKRVAMVGDGINDAPALAVADVGIALGSGTDIAGNAADVTLLRGIAGLPTALSLARHTFTTIRRNLVAASIYNLVLIPVAAAGLLSPVVASAAMSLSSLSVLLSSLALRRAKS